MKKVLLVIFTILSITYSYAAKTEDITKYRIKEYPTFEECKEHYLNKVITYSPVETTIFGSKTIIQQLNLDFKMRDFTVVSMKLDKKKKDYYIMDWTIKEVNGNITKSFKVYAGNYTKPLHSYSDSEILFSKLQFFDFSLFKEENKADIGQVFTNPLVKAKYEVVDVYPSIKEDTHDYKKKIFKVFKVKNSVTGEINDYLASEAKYECFKEDLSGRYVSTLSKVEKPSNPSVKYGKTTTVGGIDVTKYSYEDNFINIIIFGDSERFSFTLKNVSQTTQKLIWNEAVFIDIHGSTSKIMHSGIRYSERESPQPPSTIIKGASLDDIACPTANVFYDTFFKEWRVRSMYPQTVSKDTYNVRLMLPIQIKDVTNEYIFVFDVKYQYNHPDRLNL